MCHFSVCVCFISFSILLPTMHVLAFCSMRSIEKNKRYMEHHTSPRPPAHTSRWERNEILLLKPRLSWIFCHSHRNKIATNASLERLSFEVCSFPSIAPCVPLSHQLFPELLSLFLSPIPIFLILNHSHEKVYGRRSTIALFHLGI